MSEDKKVEYAAAINAARKGDEESYEFLYNQSVQKCRALSMKYFDPATEEGRRKTDEVVREAFLRLYERIKTLYDPEDYPILGARVTREVCLQKVKGSTVQLEGEEYIGVGEAPEEQTPLVTAEECRAEVRETSMLSDETIGTLVLAVLHRMTNAQRLAIIRWNADDPAAMKNPAVLREAFIEAEKAVMDIEQQYDLRARDFAKSRLAFFNWLLDLYDRFFVASTKDWNGALEPAYALSLSPDAAPEEAAVDEVAPTFQSIWEEIRQQFYIRNTMELKLPKGETEKDYRVYLDGEGEEESGPETDAAPAASDTKTEGKQKTFFLSRWWGKCLLGLLIILIVLAFVVATAGQHTSHALTASVQIADSLYEQVCVFNIS